MTMSIAEPISVSVELRRWVESRSQPWTCESLRLNRPPSLLRPGVFIDFESLIDG